MSAKFIEVAAAVLQKSDGTFLLTQRPPGKSYAGYWEFPGGKIEPEESVQQALVRELHEELGIQVITAYPWLTREFTYPHATVRLKFFRVTQWHGEPSGRENQYLRWQSPFNLTVAPVLPANIPILRALQLPVHYAISNVAELGIQEFLKRLQQALDNGLRLLQIREKNLPYPELKKLAQQIIDLAHAHHAQVLINQDIELAREIGADGVHLTSAQLMSLSTRSHLAHPGLEWCAASCHNENELLQANALGLDFVVLGPVLPTRSHTGAPHLGWPAFATLAANSAIPVYALGGLKYNDLENAHQHGAHGVALLSQV
ncbi:MAG: Nudix family hydrolase [Candidatus Nitrotoga sp.]